MKKFPAVLAAAVLGAAGFAAAGIASGGSLLQALTGTTDTTATTTAATTTTSTTSGGGRGRKVTICHHTHSKSHPLQTITVAQPAVKAHLKHHDALGACPTAPAATTGSTTTTPASHGKSDAEHGKPAATTTATSTPDDASKGPGNGNGGGKGHGKP
jgi:hypothetical protein